MWAQLPLMTSDSHFRDPEVLLAVIRGSDRTSAPPFRCPFEEAAFLSSLLNTTKFYTSCVPHKETVWGMISF